MPPSYAPIDRLIATLDSALRWAGRNTTGLALAAIGIALLFSRRRDVLNLAWTLSWFITSHVAPPPRALLATLRLIERRASWTGRPRSIGETPSHWCGTLAGSAPEHLARDLRNLVRLAQWSAFAPGPLPAGVDAASLCRRVVRGWTLRAFRTITPPVPRPKEPAS
jgi:hypothetical protein